jgi:hypothetical protein
MNKIILISIFSIKLKAKIATIGERSSIPILKIGKRKGAKIGSETEMIN